jgi:hypothetical protein
LHIGRQRGGYRDESYDDKSHINPSLGCARMYRADTDGARDQLNLPDKLSEGEAHY